MPRLMGLALAMVLFMVADMAFASIYVPGQIRDGIYIRPHFVSSPGLPYDPRLMIEMERGDPTREVEPQPATTPEPKPATNLLPGRSS